MGEPKPKLSRRQWTVRIGIALLVGATLTVTAILAAWQGQALAYPINWKQGSTKYDLEKMRNALTAYLRDNGALPLKLPEPNEADWLVFRTDGNGTAVDAWGHPLIYRRDGNSFVVISLGLDGKPSGVGLDCDLSTSAPSPPQAHPTFKQFLFELPTGGVIWSFAFSGLLGSVLTLLALRTPGKGGPKVVMIAVKMVFTIIGAAFVASVLLTLHYSGH